MRFDHAGIVTDDAAALADLYTDLLGAEVVHEERFDGIDVVFLDLGNGYFELLEPRESGTISDYLEERGSGIHHLALQTERIEATLERAHEHGVELVDEEPREGAWGHDVAFCHPRDTGGVLIEFVEH